MKKLLTILIFVLLLTSNSAVFAQTGEITETPSAPDPKQSLPLCLPGVYVEDPQDCLPLGSSQILTDLARDGLDIPLKPLPIAAPDATLVELDQKYAKLNLQYGDRAAFYPNLDSAVAGINAIRYLPSGETLYIAYNNQSDVNGGHYVQVESQEWVRASPTNYSTFQGVELLTTPAYDFGWILDGTNPRSEPGYQAEVVSVKLVREQFVQVYDQVEKDKTTWYMIGLGQWVEQRYIGVVNVNTTPPDGVENGRWIEINLFQQTLSVYDNNELVFATIIATGVDPYFTQPGLFQIYEKKEIETMTGAFAADKSDYYFLENVPWTMYFDQSRALHGAYWRALFGYQQSHGCVNLSIGDSHWIYDWGEVGDWVYVWDSSGQTPTDPSFYGAGGA